MLDREDIRMIGDLLDQKLEEQSGRFDRKLEEQSACFDQKLEEQSACFDRKMEEQSARFDQKLEEQSAWFDRKLEEQEARFDKKFEEQNTCFGKRMEEQEVRFDEKLSRSIRESENLVLEAGERNRAILEQKIDDLRVDVSELQQYYRANRMQQDTTELLRKQVKGLEERVEILEARIG